MSNSTILFTPWSRILMILLRILCFAIKMIKNSVILLIRVIYFPTNFLKYSKQGWVQRFTNMTQEHNGGSGESQQVFCSSCGATPCVTTRCAAQKQSISSVRQTVLAVLRDKMHVKQRCCSQMFNVLAFNKNNVCCFWTNSLSCIQSLKARQICS